MNFSSGCLGIISLIQGVTCLVQYFFILPKILDLLNEVCSLLLATCPSGYDPKILFYSDLFPKGQSKNTVSLICEKLVNMFGVHIFILTVIFNRVAHMFKSTAICLS